MICLREALIMKILKIVLICFTTVLISLSLLAAGHESALAEQPTISDRVTHYRAIDAVVWAMPLLWMKGMKVNSLEFKKLKGVKL